MRLHERDQPARASAASRRERDRHLGRRVPVVVVEVGAARAPTELEPSVHAGERAERLGGDLGRHAELGRHAATAAAAFRRLWAPSTGRPSATSAPSAQARGRRGPLGTEAVAP